MATSTQTIRAAQDRAALKAYHQLFADGDWLTLNRFAVLFGAFGGLDGRIAPDEEGQHSGCGAHNGDQQEGIVEA